jgi:toluene monooxygenase system protein B
MAEPQPVPINAKFQDDFVTQLVLVDATDTMAELATKVAHHVVGRRVPARDMDMVVRYDGRVIPADVTVTDAGIEPLQNVYVDWVDSPKVAQVARRGE